MKTINLLIVFLLVVSSILLVYWNVFFNDFLVTWDDDVYVLDNPYLSISEFGDILHLFTITYEGNYHPLTLLSLAIDYWMWGKQPIGYHLTNILLHLLNSLLVYWLAIILINHRLSALGAALLFGLHPMHVESVAWVSERKDVLFLFFLLCGLISYLYARKKDFRRIYLLTFVFFGCSILSKPTAVVFPLLLFILDAWQNYKINIVNKLPYLLVSIFFCWVTVYSQQSVEAIADRSYFTLWQRVQLFAYSWVSYFYKFLLPIDQTGLYHYPAAGAPFSILMKLAPFILLLLGVATVLLWQRNKYLVLGIAFFTISLLPVMQIIPVGNALIAERYTYLPYLGLNLSVFMTIYLIAQQFKRSTTLLVGISVLLIMFAIQTTERTKIWQSDETFWTDVILKNPNSSIAHFGLGNYRFIKKDYETAANIYKKVLEFDPYNLQANSFLAFLYNKLNQPNIALNYMDRVITLDSTNIEMRLKRGKTLMKLKYLEDALLDFNACIKQQSDQPEFYALRAENYFVLGDIQNAAKDWQKAIDLDSKDAKVYYNLGIYHYENKDFINAKLSFKTAVHLNPEKENYKIMATMLDEIEPH